MCDKDQSTVAFFEKHLDLMNTLELCGKYEIIDNVNVFYTKTEGDFSLERETSI